MHSTPPSGRILAPILALVSVLALPSVAEAQTRLAGTEPAEVNLGPTWTLRTENDKFSSVPGGTDRYYTAGDEISYMSAPNKVPEAARDLAGFLFGSGTTWLGVSAAQQIYTANNTKLIHPDPTDRPYAGYLAVTTTLIQDQANVRNVFATSLGVIGPSALGRPIQNGFHVIIGSDQSHGWGSQLPDEPAVEFTGTHIWRHRLANAGPLEVDALPSATIGVGTVRDYVQVGGRLRIGHGLDRDFGPGRITDGPSGEDAFLSGEGIGYYFFVGASGQAIARDAFLDGALFSNSASVNRRPLMGDFEGGVALLWHGARISYTHTWQTDAFQGQTKGLFNFGSIAASVRF